MLRNLIIVIAAATTCLVNLGCQSARPNATAGGLLGGTGGGIVGAAIGSQSGHTDEGALIGAIAGGVTGATLGNQVDVENYRRQQVANGRDFAARQAAVTLDQVVQLTQSGLSDELILNQIKSNGLAKSVTTSDLIQLKNYGVSDQVIRQMQTTGSAVTRNTAPEIYPASPVFHGEPVYPPVFRAPPVIFTHPHHFPAHRAHHRHVPRHRAGVSVQF
jgi:hypothetical protein